MSQAVQRIRCAGPLTPGGTSVNCQDQLACGTRIAVLWQAVTLMCLLSGCASATGLLIADVHRTQGAWVVAIEGFGATVRTISVDAGLTLGYERRIYVYPERIDESLPEGRYYLFVPLPNKAPIAFNARAIGLDVRASSIGFGFTLGYRDETLLARASAEESLYMHLVFLPDDVGATRLIYCPEEDPCWPINIRESVFAPR